MHRDQRCARLLPIHKEGTIGLLAQEQAAEGEPVQPRDAAGHNLQLIQCECARSGGIVERPEEVGSFFQPCFAVVQLSKE